MRQDIHLFLNDKEVLFKEPPEILFTFQRTDYTNPSLIKNSFSKTVTVEGTPENNKIFNEIWKLDRTQNNALFNPSRRVPFSLYLDSDITETGYAKLDNIKRNGYKVEYEITLYGGLGDFFYGLSYGFDYDSEKKMNASAETAADEELKLCDLTYYSNSTDDDTEFNFAITKDAVYNAWRNLIVKDAPAPLHTKNMWDYINFAPAYNGLPDDFDADKVLINTNDYESGCRISVPAGATVDGTKYSTQQIIQQSTIPTAVTIDGTNYTTLNGWAMAELREELTEWEAKDLRSYLQRPILSVKGLFGAIQRYSKEKGGYTLKLDGDFFSSGNPYYNEAWITLPMLSNLNGEYAESAATGVLALATTASTEDTDDGFYESFYHKKAVTTYNVYGLPEDVESFNAGSITFKFGIDTTQESAGSTWATDLITSWTSGLKKQINEKPTFLSAYDVQLIAYNDNDEIVAQSKHHLFSSKYKGYYNNDTYFGSDTAYYPYDSPVVHTGTFHSDTRITKGTFYWTTDDGYDSTEFTVSLTPSEAKYSKLNLVVTRFVEYTKEWSDLYNARDWYNILINKKHTSGMALWTRTGFVMPFTKSSVSYKPSEDTMKSYQLITKRKLLSQDGTPAEYMISYCKLFNLYFDKDPIQKIITIRTRKNFYDGQIVSIEDKIDRGDEINITPIVFENKWYDFNYTEGDACEFADKYSSTWGTNYGKQKVNTGYNFDNSSNDLLEGNQYENGVEVLEKSRYFKARSVSGNTVPSFLYEWSDFKLFNVSEAAVETQDEMYIGMPNTQLTDNYSANGARYDCFPKLQLHGDDNSPIDGSNILVFFNGFKDTKTGSRDYPLKYYITDDTVDMYSLNNDTSCWIATDSTETTQGVEIAKLLTRTVSIGRKTISIPILPTFGRNILVNNDYIAYTFDFGKCNELFIPNASYITANKPNLYNRFWKDYIEDMYDVRARVVEANVKLDGKVEGDWLKHFYFFDNSIWCLTKIEDYNISSFGTTKCQFVKVLDGDMYRTWYGFNISYNNVSLWLEPEQDQEYVEVYKFKISQALEKDLVITYTYNVGGLSSESSSETITIPKGSTESDNIKLTAQDFDGDGGDDDELTGITFVDNNGEDVVNGFADGLGWVFLDKSKFANFVSSMQAMNNGYGIDYITNWGSSK